MDCKFALFLSELLFPHLILHRKSKRRKKTKTKSQFVHTLKQLLVTEQCTSYQNDYDHNRISHHF